MKKILAMLLLTLIAVPAMAHHRPHHFHNHGMHRHFGPAVHYHGRDWVTPLVIGGVVGAVIASRPSTQTETVIVQPQSVVVKQENCSPWTETQQPDGTIVRTRTCVN